jgi:hypothetical protein
MKIVDLLLNAYDDTILLNGIGEEFRKLAAHDNPESHYN